MYILKPMKELKELSKWRDAPRPPAGRLDIVKVPLPPNLICGFCTISTQIQQILLWMDKLTLQFLRRGKGAEQPTQKWRRRTKSEDWGWRPPRLTKRLQYRWKNTQTNRAEPRAQTRTHTHRSWSLTKEQRHHHGAQMVFPTNGAGTTGHDM